jgi:ATP-dependent DNA helicase DinG
VERAPVAATLAALRDRLAVVSARLDGAASRGEALANCALRAGELLDRLDVVTSAERDDMVAWYERTRRGFILRLTPVDISTTFRERRRDDRRAWIYTSATLAINGRFDYFQERMGLETADTRVWQSPFDYEQQALLYLPPGLPQPQSPQYTAKVMEAIIPVLNASRGRAFVLFTSHRALQEAAQLLPERIRWPVLVQGSAPRPRLLARFRETEHAVLLATGSFWEGVDVRGEALSCVVIDKLPFASPADPVLQARARAMEEQGRNPFMEYQLPNAVISLKQGAGRLIRGSGDRGILVLCDPRLLEKRYGRFFLDSLPPMRRSRELADVQDFFEKEPA